MMLDGHKTKIGCVVMLIAAGLGFFYYTISLPIFMIGVAIAFYGLYDRNNRNTDAQIKVSINNTDSLKSRFKKPMLRGGV